jgi:hypothetical protein
VIIHKNCVWKFDFLHFQTEIILITKKLKIGYFFKNKRKSNMSNNIENPQLIALTTTNSLKKSQTQQSEKTQENIYHIRNGESSPKSLKLQRSQISQAEKSLSESSFNFINFSHKVAGKVISKLSPLTETEARLLKIKESTRLSHSARNRWQKAFTQVILANRALLALGKLKRDKLAYGLGKDECLVTSIQKAQTKRQGCIIMPTHRFKIIWDAVSMLLLLYTATFVPYKLAYLPHDDFTIYVIDNIVDVLFLADIFVNFLTAYYNYDNLLITSHAKIAKKYLCTWFIFDLVVCFPFQLVLSSEASQYNGLIRLLKLPRLYRIARLAKIGKVFKSIENTNPFVEKLLFKLLINAGMLRLLQTLFMLIIFIHLFACAWFLTARIVEFTPNTW